MTRDFAPVSIDVNIVELLVVHPADSAKYAAEVVANSKKEEPTAMASMGIGRLAHFAIEQLKDAVGTNVLHVPYKGAAPAITDRIGGQVTGRFGDIPGLTGHVRGGKLRAIGLASTSRNPALPSVKALAEQGISNVDTNNWNALFAPAKTPAATITALNDAVRRALANPALKAKLLDTGTEPAPSTPAELAELLDRDSMKWGKLIRDNRIKAE